MKRRDDFLIGAKEKAAEAIKAGKTDEALKYLNEVHEGFRRLHDVYCDTISLLMGALAEIKGEKWLEAFDRARIYEGNRQRFQSFKSMTVEERVSAICNMHRSHYTEFHVEEDDEKYVVVITGCNGGARLLKDGIAVKQSAVTKKAHRWSSNRIGFPYYCAHAFFFDELFHELGLNMEFKWGRQYNELGKPIDEPCMYIIYK